MKKEPPEPSDLVICREGSEEEVLSLFQARDNKVSEQEALWILKNSNTTWTSIHHIQKDREIMAYHKIQAAMAGHRATPLAIAQRLIQLLYWKELLEIALNVRALPMIRRGAEKLLRERLLSMGLGEKITLARRAPQALIPNLRKEKHLKIVQALMENPRMTMAQVQVMSNDTSTTSEILTYISQNPRWSSQRQIRMALIMNSSTPLGVALGFLSSMTRADLQGLSKNPSINHAIKLASKRLLEGRDKR